MVQRRGRLCSSAHTHGPEGQPLGQDLRLLDHLSAFDNIALPLRINGGQDAQIGGVVAEMMGWLGLADLKDATPRDLSMAQRQLVAVARAVIARPGLLLCDEPTSHVDDKLARRIVHMGPNGAGYAMKLAVNLGLGGYIQALSESLALGVAQGLTLEQMLDVLKEAPTATGWLTAKIPVLLGGKADVTLDIRTLRKDIMSAVATGALSGVPMPLSAGTLASLSAAVAGGAGSGDLADLAKFVREQLVQDYK